MSTLEDDAKGTPFEGLLKGNGVRSEPPEDLRAAILKAGNIRFATGAFTQKRYSDGSVSPIDHKVHEIVEIEIDDLLRLCEAAALAALPEKYNNWKDVPPEKMGGLASYSKLSMYRKANNQAIATAQANIHSVFGGKSNG